jgi:hypothetical protein
MSPSSIHEFKTVVLARNSKWYVYIKTLSRRCYRPPKDQPETTSPAATLGFSALPQKLHEWSCMSEFHYTECSLKQQCDLLRDSSIKNWQKTWACPFNTQLCREYQDFNRGVDVIAAASLDSNLRSYTLFGLIQNRIKAHI